MMDLSRLRCLSNRGSTFCSEACLLLSIQKYFFPSFYTPLLTSDGILVTFMFFILMHLQTLNDTLSVFVNFFTRSLPFCKYFSPFMTRADIAYPRDLRTCRPLRLCPTSSRFLFFLLSSPRTDFVFLPFLPCLFYLGFPFVSVLQSIDQDPSNLQG
jgi:hypothetical protein